MNAAKRKREPHPLAQLVARFLPFLQGGWRRTLAALGLVVLFLGTVVFAWHRWGPQITQTEEYVVLPENIELTPRPKWIRTDVKAEVIRDAGLTHLSLLDKQLTVRVAQAFAAHQWIERVKRVHKYKPPRLVVEVEYRQPVAMVEVVTNGQPGLLPVDRNGVLLPPADFSAEQAHDFLRIAAADTAPAGPVGTVWGDPRVHGASCLAWLLQDTWKTLGLYRITTQLTTASNRATRSAEEPALELLTRRGTRVLWGPAPRADDSAETSAARRKISRLLAFAQANGTLDGDQPPREIDMRPKNPDPRTATRPLLAPRGGS